MIFVTFQTWNELYNDFSKSDTYSTKVPCSIIHPYNCVVLYKSEAYWYTNIYAIFPIPRIWQYFSQLSDWLLSKTKHFAPSPSFRTSITATIIANISVVSLLVIIKFKSVDCCLIKLHWCWITWLINICNAYLMFNDLLLIQTSDFKVFFLSCRCN